LILVGCDARTSNDKSKSRSFDSSTHDKAVSAFAQDDTSTLQMDGASAEMGGGSPFGKLRAFFFGRVLVL
jgi:hypothetical protein